MDVVQHNDIGHQVHVLDLLLLLYRVVALQHRASEADPVEEVVVGLHLGRLRADAAAQISLGNVAQQEQRPHDPPQLAERAIQSVLAAVAAELAQQRRGQDLAGRRTAPGACRIGSTRPRAPPDNDNAKDQDRKSDRDRYRDDDFDIRR